MIIYDNHSYSYKKILSLAYHYVVYFCDEKMKDWLESTETELNKKVIYWADLWEELTSNFNKNFYGLDFRSPHILLKNTISEIRFNGFGTSYVKANFYKKLKVFSAEDPVLEDTFETELELLKKNFKGPTTSYLLSLCRDLLNQFEEGKYFGKATDMLVGILLDDAWGEKDKEQIKILTRNIIIELFLKGYSIEEIKKMPFNILDRYQELPEGNHIATRYPHNLDIDDFEKRGTYNDALKGKIDNLSLKERLKKLKHYYFKDTETFHFIFPVKGLKGKDIDVNLGKVHFYSINSHKYLKDQKRPPGDVEFESFHREEEDAVNVAVEIKTLDVKGSKLKAISTANKALNLIHLYFHTKTDLEVNENRYLVVDKEGGFRHSSESSEDQEWYKKKMALDLKRQDPTDRLNSQLIDKTKDFLYLKKSEQTEIESTITNSLHWYTKSEESTNFEDKLLNYWISMENLINFSSSIDELLSYNDQKEDNKYNYVGSLLVPIQVFNFIPQVGWRLYHYINNLVSFIPMIDLSDELMESANLDPDPGTKIHLKPFLNSLDEIRKSINRQMIKERIDYTQNFYSNNNFAESEIVKREERLKDNMLLVYRYRNRIVHNAHYDDKILPYYVQVARNCARNSLAYILNQYSVQEVDDIESVLMDKYTEFKKLKRNLEKDREVDLLDLGY